MHYQKFIVYLFVALAFQSTANAALEININQGTVRGLPIAIVPFKTTSRPQVEYRIGHQIDQIISDDLRASGKFDIVDSKQFLSFPSRNEEVRFKDWRIIDTEALVIGQVQALGNNQYEITFRVYDVAREQSLNGLRFRVSGQQLRNAAHVISDYIYKKFMGRPGAFNSKIAFIKKTMLETKKNRYSLMIADWDGYGEREVYGSWRPLLSPSWSPDSTKLAFVSFNDNGPIVQVLTLATGDHSVIASFKGVNSAPAWSPDGKKLAYSSSKNGSPDVFVYDFATKQHSRVTKHYGIDTEPAWSPDGKKLLFTSNRAGKPQIYQTNLYSKKIDRITYEGKENANASYDFEGRQIVLVTEGGKIMVMQQQSKRINLLTNAKFDESPSFSPNGDMVLYATEENYTPSLVVASSDGRVKTKLKFINGDIREPAWSPLKNN